MSSKPNGIRGRSSWNGHREIVVRCRNFLRQLPRALRRLTLVLPVLVIMLVLTGALIRAKLNRKHAYDGIDAPNFLNMKEKLSFKNLALKIDFPFEVGCRIPDTQQPRANASFVMLARNKEVDDVVKSIKAMERHFNQWFNYPWVFLNDEEFDDNFKSEVKKHTNSEVEFGMVPKEHWDFPSSVDKNLFAEAIESQGDRGVMYGNMPSYHKMCRFYSGHFYDHPLVKKRKWYWRVEPDVQYFCDLTYDPFIEMEKHNKKYGFTIALHELYYTIPSLFRETKVFIEKYDIKVASSWEMIANKFELVTGKNADQYAYVADRKDFEKQVKQNVVLKRILEMKKKSSLFLEGLKGSKNVKNIFEAATDKPPLYEDRYEDEEYNLCHFWTNFEIAQVDVFTSEIYQLYFQHLEESGGFYRERWGDAPVHSIAVAMILPREEMHYFRDIGYQHTTLRHCPNNAPGKQLPYEPARNYKGGDESEPRTTWASTFRTTNGPDVPEINGVGCRCTCPPKGKDVEDKSSYCIKQYLKVVSDDFKPIKAHDADAMEHTVGRYIDRKLKQGKKLGHFAIP